MELFDQIRKISFIFFVSVGLIHFLAGFMFINGYYVPTSGLVNRVLFVPFAISMITYGFSNIKCYLIENGKDSKNIDYALIGLGIAIFVILMGTELLIADSPRPLMP